MCVCVCAADEESVVSPAMMAPYLGHFSPSSGELLTASASSTHSHGITSSMQTGSALQEPVVCINYCFSFRVCLHWEMKELKEKEGGTDPLTSPLRG